MNTQDYNKDFHLKLSTEFNKIDEFLAEFQNVFTNQLLLIMNQQFTETIQTKEINEHILLYANKIFNCAESVFDKDKNYSEWRLMDELNSMTFALEKLQQLESNQKFAAETHRMAKKIMIRFFPNLVDLSANGFRLLEKYCLLYNREFVLAAI